MMLADTEPLLACLDGEIDHYIMISSSDVYARYERLHKRATGGVNTGALDENAPLRSTRYPYRTDTPRPTGDPERCLDDYDKIPIEEATRRLASAWTILRLPMVYGPGDKQHRFRWAISPMLRKQTRLVIPRTWANWHSTYGYIDNVGSAIAQTIGDERARNTTFNVAEETPVSQLEWARRFARASSWQGVVELTDDPADPLAQRIAGLDLDVPFSIDGSKLRIALGFSDVVDEISAVQQTLDSEMGH